MDKTQDLFKAIAGDGSRDRLREQATRGLVADSCVFASWMSRSTEICPLIVLIFWSFLKNVCIS
jgi:hypothetical protein